MNNITIEEVKDILKCSIDETTNMNEAIERTLQHIYLKGWNDAAMTVTEFIKDLPTSIEDENIKNCENCGWWTCKDMNKRRCQYCYKQDEWISDYDDNNWVYKENITIKADKHIKGYSNNYPLLCDLEVIFSNNKEWITLRDNRDNSITVEIKSLIKLLGK